MTGKRLLYDLAIHILWPCNKWRELYIDVTKMLSFGHVHRPYEIISQKLQIIIINFCQYLKSVQ